MKRILFIERQPSVFVSIESVFRQVAAHISSDRFATDFQQMPFGNSLLGIVKNLLFFKPREADLYHVTGHIHYIALRLPADRTVLTIHDLGFLHTRRGLRRLVLKKLFLDWPLRKLKYITAVSQKTKDEILDNTNCDPDKILVIDNPLTDGFGNSSSKVFDTERPTILQIGITDNKNIPRLAEAITGLPCRLLIVGGADSDLISLLSTAGIDYEIKGFLERSDIVDLYRNADLITFCSTYEGFGLPIIEAQACGKPVITSNLSPMKEVGGGAAIFVDPHDAADIRRGILQVIESAELRKKLIGDGLENVKRFDPKLIAKKYEMLYLEVLGTKPSDQPRLS